MQGITGEAAVALIESICNVPLASQSLSVVIFPVLNRWGRDKVIKEGMMCQRSNKEGLDLNRDFPTILEKTDRAPVSKEIKLLRTFMDHFQPGIFVDVHSGNELIGLPPGSDLLDVKGSSKSKLNFMTKFTDTYLSGLKVGNLQKLLKYDAPGNSVDYAFTTLPYPSLTLGVEIYEQSTASRTDAIKLLGGIQTQPGSQTADVLRREQCLFQFNPYNQDTLSQTLLQWVPVLYKTLDKGFQFLSRQPNATF
ncbi:zinc carboxypeptidase [Gregarina niphandrodes]|uniref:Zinc carboxypeptidase n=1 Tax=Gregarina niphandrodes TaxID=110365 RepID=A0A023B3H4_GRENI|nr:zinc carboxypeptidase [Gregarina niphandrodes]EZG55524.1 zinc carboxypeptidase [Gregarina niphandrodes]|eukprot:XP_011131510.1 zinc carboxypeptidase [Gregarina niphandrodes]